MTKTKNSKNDTLLKELRRDMDKVTRNGAFTWSMDSALEYILWKGFKSFAEHVAGYPHEYQTLEDWQADLKQQSRLWKYVHKNHFSVDTNVAMNVVAYRERALKFLYDHWSHLWW